jgi:hypothetical protein
MKIRKNKSDSIIGIIDHLELDLMRLRKALLLEGKLLKGKQKTFRSVQEYEFCGMWKNRKDIEGLSSSEWLSELRKKQWGRTQ